MAEQEDHLTPEQKFFVERYDFIYREINRLQNNMGEIDSAIFTLLEELKALREKEKQTFPEESVTQDLGSLPANVDAFGPSRYELAAQLPQASLIADGSVASALRRSISLCTSVLPAQRTMRL